MTRLTDASQARRRAASDEIGPTSSSSAPERVRAGAGRAGRRKASLQRLKVHGDRDVGALASHEGAIGGVQPLPADLSQCIGPSLWRGADVPLRSHSCVADGPKGTDDRLPGLRIQVSVHPDHARERRGDVQAASFVRPLGELGTPGVLGGPGPGGHDPAQVRDGERGCRLHEVALGLCKGLRIDLLCGHQHIHGRRGDLALLQSLAGGGICSSALACRTRREAADQVFRKRCASQEVSETCPSRA